MIEAFSLKTAHLFGDALASQARLRYRVFVRHRGLLHMHCDGMEYDEFDTPATVYLVWRDPDLIVRGLIRISPTSMPYMLKSYWPSLCQTRELPACDDVWEMTRVCIDRDYDPRIRMRITPELLSAVQEFCDASEIRAVVGVTRKHLLAHFIHEGIEWLGDEAEIEGEKEAAFRVAPKYLRPHKHCRTYGIGSTVLSLEPISQRVAA